jgi:hypothetical protein
MNKSEQREIATLEKMHALGGYTENIALALSSLIRAARKDNTKVELLKYAVKFNVMNHPQFITNALFR